MASPCAIIRLDLAMFMYFARIDLVSFGRVKGAS